MPAFELVHSFASKDQCFNLMEAANTLIDREYTVANLESHLAYVSDRSEARESFAFAVFHRAGGNADLPGLRLTELPQPLNEITDRVLGQLGVGIGRVLLNIQRYRAGSKVVTRHFDGEYFEYSIMEGGALVVQRAIRPEVVAILTLLNDSEGGGTTLFPGNADPFLVQGAAGDLLIFDNLALEHGVQSLVSRGSLRSQEWIRYVIGWRPIEDRCWYATPSATTKLTPREAAALSRDFLRNEWPARRAEALRRATF